MDVNDLLGCIDCILLWWGVTDRRSAPAVYLRRFGFGVNDLLGTLDRSILRTCTRVWVSFVIRACQRGRAWTAVGLSEALTHYVVEVMAAGLALADTRSAVGLHYEWTERREEASGYRVCCRVCSCLGGNPSIHCTCATISYYYSVLHRSA